MAEMVFLIELLALYKSRNLSVKRRYKRKSPQNIGDWHYIEHCKGNVHQKCFQS